MESVENLSCRWIRRFLDFRALSWAMFILRRILLIAMLVVSGSGSSPLWLHQLLHHSDCGVSLGANDRHSAKNTCGCNHAFDRAPCATQGAEEPHEPADPKKTANARIGNQHSDHQCAACYQLSQSTSAPCFAPAVCSRLVATWIASEFHDPWNAHVPRSASPRGPPV